MRGKHERQFSLFKESVLAWYTAERWDKIYPYITGKVFSRRFIEHFITEYARSHTCEYTLTDEFTGDVFNFNVYHAAQTVLIGTHKRHMDPFGRKNRDAADNGQFEFGFGEKKALVSVCSLVFFRWAHKHKIMEYAHEHEDDIRRDMNALTLLKRHASSSTTTNAIVPVDEIEIELPLAKTRDDAAACPLKDEYWQAAVEECMQRPRKRRKRYRECAVDMIVNDACEIQARV